MAPLTVAVAGDCMSARGGLVGDEEPAVRLQQLLHGVDFACANLEVVPNDWHGHPARDPWGGGLVAASAVLDALTDLGFTVFGCANNHALDMGVDGLLATVRELRARGLPFAGIGPDLHAARMPVYVDRPGGSLALLSCSSTFTPGQEAAEASPELQGRPGLSPLRHTTEFRVTREQLGVLREVDRVTGMRSDRAGLVEMIGSDPWDGWPETFTFMGARFRADEESQGRRTACDPADLDDISRWVRDARRRADVVLVSVHSHESGGEDDQPPQFLREFAHRMVDEGADAVFGHGPHRMRGMELYRGRPVFYSLGNMVNQLELVERLSGESYALLSTPGRATPGQFFALRGDHGRRGQATDRRCWETVLPVLTFDAGRLTRLRLHPVTLGLDAPPHRRGRPRLAGSEERGEEILKEFGRLSQSLGAETVIENGDSGPTGEVPLDDPS